MRIVLTGLALLVLFPGTLQARSLGELEFEACTLATPGAAASVEAFCTTLEVPENHAEPEGRQIELALAWVPARNSAAPDPVFMIAGGPGQSARESYPGAAGAFADIRRQRDVLLLDQRGTGASTPLVCSLQDLFEAEADASEEAMRKAARECLDDLGDDIDPRHFTTTDAVADLELVRQRIGAQSINLVGISYGTRVAQQYAKRHPGHTRSLVIDGIVPNSLVLGGEHARNLESALDAYFQACRDEAACGTTLGDPRAALDRLLALAASDEAPLVRYRDAITGELHEDRLTRGHVAAVARMYAYSPLTAALLPLTLAEASQGRPEALMAQARMLVASLDEQIHHGMQLSVMCSEDADELSAREEDAGSVLGNELITMSLAQCSVWPRGERPADFREPLRGDLPVLVLSGELDPVTPPRYGDEVVQHLPNGRHLVLSGQGHMTLGVGCMPKLTARFIDTLDAGELDTTCLEGLRAMPPFSGFYGWEP